MHSIKTRAAQTLLLLFFLSTCSLSLKADDVKDWEKAVAEGKAAVSKNDLAKATSLWWTAAGKAEAFGMKDRRYAETLYHLGEMGALAEIQEAAKKEK